jgi:hypothetical protein
LFCSFLGSLAVTLVSALMICESLHAFARDPHRRPTLVQHLLNALFSLRGLSVVTIALAPVVAILIGPGLISWIAERQVFIHWSRVVLAGLLTFTLCQLFATKIIVAVIRIHVSRQRYVDSCRRQQRLANTIKKPTAPLPTGDVILT